MRQSKTKKESGISIIEVVIVLAVMAVLVTFAIASFRSSGSNLTRQNIAREFKVSLERARFDSVKRRASVCSDMSGVTIDDSSFTLMIDLDNDGKLSNYETRVSNLSNRGDVTIVPNGVTLPLTVRFDQRGQAYINDCSPGAIPTATIPLLYFCNGACTPQTANGENSNVIFVSPAGTVAMLYGGESMPSFDEPAVTAVDPASDVNPLLSIWNELTGSPSPTPVPTPSGTPDPNGTPTPDPNATPTPDPNATPTPDPNATPTPTPTPDPNATPTPTPTPVPTPSACPTTAPWGIPPACTCMAPQTVRSGGRCK
jgi:type II secretory pathway pseudopilin PulG